MAKRWMVGTVMALLCAGLVLVPIVQGKGNKYATKDPKGDIARAAPRFFDIVKTSGKITSGKRTGRTLVNKIKVKGTLPRDLAKISSRGNFQLLVTDLSGTSYFTVAYPREGMKVRRAGKKTLKFTLTKRAVGSFKGLRWAVYSQPNRGRDDRSPNRKYTYLRYKK